ncbi:hypothetical protein FHS18_005682 [Paenibacillus phyllosphaerae]|uniref:Uncharacterized protein n=1 Tax=Paenibacillus phyllosphaerae TaxID=274593 RepID=A0A7W5B354_9BACL|nr:hypothetical protein [Paenibacillus phyllosphaerae]MBB3113570.1 hypothetical protein [Paenibacillus phyllosphaerae]
MFYHWWIYTHIINTSWFMWGIAWTLLGLNFAMPVMIWYIMSSRSPFRHDDEASKK